VHWSPPEKPPDSSMIKASARSFPKLYISTSDETRAKSPSPLSWRLSISEERIFMCSTMFASVRNHVRITSFAYRRTRGRQLSTYRHAIATAAKNESNYTDGIAPLSELQLVPRSCA
jgi:hypothetical protein